MDEFFFWGRSPDVHPPTCYEKIGGGVGWGEGEFLDLRSSSTSLFNSGGWGNFPSSGLIPNSHFTQGEAPPLNFTI